MEIKDAPLSLVDILLVKMARSQSVPTALDTDARYRALLETSAVIVSESNLQAVLHSISELLARIVSFQSVALLLLDEKRGVMKLHALESQVVVGIDIGTELSFAGTAVAKALEEQKPVFVPDAQSELAKVPNLRERLRGQPIDSSYIFPISTSRRKLGALAFGASCSTPFSSNDVELMQSVAAHVAVALDSALSFQTAEEYQRELAHERDRLRLLLEINNHIVSRLEIDDFFRAASASIRKFFDSDLTGFWVLDEKSSRLNCAVLDFPSGRGFLADIEIPELSEEQIEQMRLRAPVLKTIEEIEREMPRSVTAPIRAESIVSLAHIPLVSARGPLGVISLGSRKVHAFSQRDLDLLSQAATQIALALDNALAYGRLSASRNRLEDERVYLESEIRSEYGFEDIIGESPALRRVLEQVSIVAPTGSTVLLMGETGTGKELVARAIHNLSARSRHTFVRLNCAAIPSGLVESELFGHEKGAFTGALAQKRGRFELAHEGSLFLDEIGDISLELQPKLLRAIQEQEFERLGSNRTIRVDVRLIAATHRNLPQMIRDGHFREDLFYRLNVFPVEIPPLRERREDIPLLVHYFVSRLARRMQKSIRTIPAEAMRAMANWDWPGNIRELENFIERAVILTHGDTLSVPAHELRAVQAHKARALETARDAERGEIIAALRAAKGRLAGKAGAAERLGVKRTTLQNRMHRLNITKRDYL